MSSRSGFRRAWMVLLAACVLLVGLLDALLLELGRTFFTAGYNAVYLEGAGAIAAFVASSLLVDLALICGVWSLVLPLVATRRGTILQKLVVVSLVSIAVPLTVDFVRYQGSLVLGRFSLAVLWEIAGGTLQQVLSEVALHAGPLLLLLATGAAGSFALVWFVGRVQRAKGWGTDCVLPDPRSFAKAFAGLLLISALLLVGTLSTAPRLYSGLSSKPSAAMLTALVQWTTDVDRDGFGLLSRPADPAAFDADRHPYAVDVAGNGIDENGLAGDRPASASALTSSAPGSVSTAHSRRPDFLLVYLESFRADRLGAQRNGRAITPFLSALAAAGAHSERAYVNSPYTIWSRAQLFGGSLHPHYGQPTLVDDFKQLGYTVAHFSGQDDSFGRSIELLGLDRVDSLYDARQDADKRTSRSGSAGSLQVSWKLLERRIDEYLRAHDRERPLFLYVNLVDTHFPYTHDEMDDLLAVSPLGRYEISAANAEAVRATYDNAVANVDRAMQRIVERFREAVGGDDYAILVTSDHGQGLFERDFLGHGQALSDDQTRTPFVLFGVGGEWPEPLGMADVRGLLLENLFVPRGEDTPRARFVPDPERRLFHFVAQIHHPRVIGLRTLEGLTSYDLDRSALEFFEAGQGPRKLSPDDETRAFEELIWTWEATRAAAEEANSRDDRQTRADPG